MCRTSLEWKDHHLMRQPIWRRRASRCSYEQDSQLDETPADHWRNKNHIQILNLILKIVLWIMGGRRLSYLELYIRITTSERPVRSPTWFFADESHEPELPKTWKCEFSQPACLARMIISRPAVLAACKHERLHASLHWDICDAKRV